MLFFMTLAISIIQPGFVTLAFEPTHEGCFTTSMVKSTRYYEINFLLTWEECIQFCNHRLTTHAGIQAENSLSTDNHCYCGNNLDILSPPAASESCTNCLDDLDKRCGGTDTISLYRIRENTPFSVLMPVRGVGLMQYTAEDSNTENNNTEDNNADNIAVHLLVEDPELWFNIDYIYMWDELYYISNDRNIQRSFYNIAQNGFVKPKPVWSNITGFTLDWTSPNSIYYAKNNQIYQITDADRQTRVETLEFYRNSSLYYFSMDPYDRRILFTEDVGPNLFSYDMENGTIHLLDNSRYFNEIMRGALDVHNQLLYLVGKYDSTLQLISMDYNGTRIRVLYSGPELTKVKALDVFHEDVVWVNYNVSKAEYTVYQCQLTPRCEEVTQLYQTTKPITTVKIYHPEKQVPGVRYLCSQLGCSHSCEQVSLFSVWCVCPPNMTIAKDMATCQAKYHS